MSKPTQKQMILNHLKTIGSLDSFTAFKEYGVLTGLRSRIADLRQEGYDIETGWLHGVSKITGRQWKIANYRLKENED